MEQGQNLAAIAKDLGICDVDEIEAYLAKHMSATDADGTAWAVTFDDTRGFGLVHRLAFARILADLSLDGSRRTRRGA